MAFTSSEKQTFIASLQRVGWKLKDDTIWSPSGGLWFDESHFTDWSPSDVKEIFTARATRIQNSGGNASENQDVCLAANKVIDSSA